MRIQKMEVDGQAATPVLRPVWGMWVTIAVTLLMLPAHYFLGMVFLLASGSRVASGRGGAFASCTTDPPECIGPNYGFLTLLIIMMLVLCFLAALIGYNFGRYRPVRYMLPLLTVLSVVLVFVGTTSLIGLQILR